MFKGMINKKRLIIAIVFLAIAAVAVLTNVALKNYLLETNVPQIKFQNGIEYKTVSYGTDVLIVNNEGMLALNRSGREIWKVVCATTSPMVDVDGKYIMLADMNGKNINIYKGEKLLTQIKTEKEILSAKMNKNGYVAVATADLGYKGLITVYDKNGTEIFKWHSGSGYIGGMDISSKNKIALAQIMTERDKVYSKIVSINIKKDGEVTNMAEYEGLAMELCYRDNETLCVVTDKGAYGFNKSGKSTYNISFGGRIMKRYNIENDNNMVFAFDNGRNGTMLESYSNKGKCRGFYDAGEAIRDFDVNGECITIGTAGRLLKVTPTGKLKKEIRLSHDVKEVEIFGNRNRAIIIGGNSAELFKI